jgi:hypothetical protein
MKAELNGKIPSFKISNGSWKRNLALDYRKLKQETV